MICLKCLNENTRDYPVCADCENAAHFTNRGCKCLACEEDRNMAAIEAQLLERRRLERAAWEEEGHLVYGWPIQAAA